MCTSNSGRVIVTVQIHSRKKAFKEIKMTTAKWTINTGEQSSRICSILLQDLIKRGVCRCEVEMLWFLSTFPFLVADVAAVGVAWSFIRDHAMVNCHYHVKCRLFHAFYWEWWRAWSRGAKRGSSERSMTYYAVIQKDNSRGLPSAAPISSHVILGGAKSDSSQGAWNTI